jgi:hypothetical protein
MALRRTRTTAAAAVASLAVALVAALPAGPAAADVYGPPRVVRDADARVLGTVYDPDDALGLEGDTHLLEIDARGGPPATIWLRVTSYTCGPHDRTQQPGDLGCPEVGNPSLLVQRARIDVLDDDSVRVRGTTPAGRLDLTLNGTGPPPSGWSFVSREWRHAAGTARERGRTVAVDFFYGVLDGGTFGGLALYQDEAWLSWSGLRLRTSTVRTGTGPAVAIPDLPPPGTQEGEWTTTFGFANAVWLRRVPGSGPAGTRDVEVGRATYDGTSPSGGYRNVQRCERGERPAPPNLQSPCEVVDWGVAGVENATADLDVAAGRVRVGFDLVDLLTPGTPATHVTFAWQGRRPVGFHNVDIERADAVASVQTFTREGVRWLRLDADGTVGGRPVDRVWDVDFTIYRQTLEMAPPP